MSDYKAIVKNLLNQKEHCHYLATQKLNNIEGAIDQCEYVAKQSLNEIQQCCSNIRSKIDEIEYYFCKSLEKSSDQQKNSLLRDKLDIQTALENFIDLTNSVWDSINSVAQEKQQECAFSSLSKIVDSIQILVKDDKDEPIFPVHFVNLDMQRNVEAINFGFLEYEKIDFQSFTLSKQPSLSDYECSFMVWVPHLYEVNNILKYFSWSVDNNDNCRVHVSGRVVDNNYRLSLFGQPGTYFFSFFIYNQHIPGSPTIFQIKADSGSLPLHIRKEKGSTFMDEKDENLKYLDKPSMNDSPPVDVQKSNLPIPNEVVAHSSPKSSPQKSPPKLAKKLVSRTIGLTKHDIRKPNIMTNHSSNSTSRQFKIAGNVPSFPLPLRTPCTIATEPIRNQSINTAPKRAPTITTSSQTLSLKTSPKSEPVSPESPEDFFKVFSIPERSKPGTTTRVLNSVLKEEKLIDYDADVDNNMPNKVRLDLNKTKELLNDILNQNVQATKLQEPVKLETKNIFTPFPKSNKIGALAEVNLPYLSMNPIAEKEFVFSGSGKIALDKPIGITQIRSGEVVVADTCNNRMVLLSHSGEFIKSFNAFVRLQRPSAVVALPDSRFAVRDDRSITTFSHDCKPLATLGTECLRKPFGLAFGNGAVITVDTGSFPRLVVSIDPNTGRIVKRSPFHLPVVQQFQEMSKLRFITFREPSHLLIVDLGLNMVYIYDMATESVLGKFGGTGKAQGLFIDPSGIACDSKGSILVGDSRNHRIQIFSSQGEFLSVLQVTYPLKRPSGISITQDGKLLVCNYWENSVIQYKLLAH